MLSFILVRELFNLQIIQGQAYINNFKNRTTKTRVIKSTRGNIFDRNGVVLASNILSYSITFEDNGSYDSTREKNLTLNGTAYKTLKILSSNGDTLSNSFHIIVDENNEFAFDISEGFNLDRFRADIFGYPLIDDMKEEERTATAQDIMDRLSGSRGFSVILDGSAAYTPEELEAHGLPEQFTKQELLAIVIMRYQLSTNSFKKYMPSTIATNVSAISVAAIMEHKNELQGIEVVEDSVRQYLDDESVAPIVGYTGKASAEELEKLREDNPDYSNDTIIGKAGIEQYLELQLQGTDGQETVTVDNLGKVLTIDENTKEKPIAGNDVTLTLDSDWQSAIYKILKQRVAGILLSKIEPIKEFDYETVNDASQIKVPIYSVYFALVDNSVIDINKFANEDASDVEKELYIKFLRKQQEIFAQVSDRLLSSNAPAYMNENPEMQDYMDYICNNLLQDTLYIIQKEKVDTGDEKYIAYNKEGSISLRDFLTYAASQNWIDITKISLEGEYLDSTEVYQALSNYIIDYLKTDLNFSKLLYKYMINDDIVSGQELELVLYEQGILSKTDETYEKLASGAISAYDFMINKIYTLEIEPAMLALMPCSASCVITDCNTGDVIACVSYPGYDNNRLANNMDTDYYVKLALDQSSPFFNKATQQKTAPGSTMKLLTTIAGMQEKIIDDNTYINCTGKFDYVQPPINCWNINGHASIEIREAIEQSCNYFFNMIGFQLGKNGQNEFSEQQSLNMLQKYANLLGLDAKTGIEISEAAPQVSDSYAVPSYIGQGTHLYTTTELARYAAVLANSGTVYDLTLIDKVQTAEGEVIEDKDPVVHNQMNVPKNVWDDIHDGMHRVVQTHKQFDGLGVALAGKTGTAEQDIYHPNHGLFIGYAPYDNPQYAMAIRVANGYTSGNACLIANDVCNYIFNLKEPDQILTGYASSDVSETSND
ncbi:MAG: penicillin-binding transpeptidase domain-containing protein [Eubacteriales bacterium]|nr:penicillin-binding transpeptidase domain-containing protein [Eubacteriales bacterium]